MKKRKWFKKAELKKKLTQKKFSWLTLLVTILCTVVVSGGSVFLVMNHQMNALKQANQAMGKISTVYNALYNNYYKSLSKTKLVEGAINGMIESLGDPYTEYMNATETQELNDSISGSFGGIGAQVQKSGNEIKIIAAISGTPAAKAGLKANDVIVKINGKSISGYSLNKAVSLMRGKIGTKVTLTIKRDGSTFTKTLTRAEIPVTTVEGSLAKEDKKVGYIVVSSFSENTAKEFKQTIKKLRKKGATSFIIDVRNNPGGLLDQALAMSSMFLKNGKTIVQVVGRDGKPTVYKASNELDDNFKVTEKTVVLMNGSSASASEIFAAALKQSANVTLVGTKSYGKGTVQNTLPFTDNTQLKLTIAKWLTPNGTWIHSKGLSPDVKADYPSVAYLPAISTKKTYSEGQNSKQIKNLQKMLIYLGYDLSEKTGYFGDQTKSVIEQYQTDNNLTVTGTANKETVESIEKQVAKKVSKSDNAYKKALEQLQK
ncbi:S41 family peptidase [Ligilactobacillus apodemi]|uniref:Carboxy-terminal processing proteinase n=1 Tax=Ligilactobacillus apodemi DSM 16634 = JCM 16172 TaxID=1423724 RepID=A0A0R1U2F5_9LACO|nr:S41 family peptidase [Ligilactobacillus apodemi]KRL83851.1 carboxy-terminal processing proteinase [Ligilactobacillus apodemi DSM 16634 = JCM 16172]